MDAPIRWNASVSGEVGSVQAKWKGVREGLRLILVGYCVALLLAGPGVALVGASRGGWSPALQQKVPLSADQAAGLGWALLAIGSATAYLTLLGGQWRCLLNASTRHGGKELLFTCMLCALASPV